MKKHSCGLHGEFTRRWHRTGRPQERNEEPMGGGRRKEWSADLEIVGAGPAGARVAELLRAQVARVVETG
jgi:hypothetical protein